MVYNYIYLPGIASDKLTDVLGISLSSKGIVSET